MAGEHPDTWDNIDAWHYQSWWPNERQDWWHGRVAEPVTAAVPWEEWRAVSPTQTVENAEQIDLDRDRYLDNVHQEPRYSDYMAEPTFPIRGRRSAMPPIVEEAAAAPSAVAADAPPTVEAPAAAPSADAAQTAVDSPLRQSTTVWMISVQDDRGMAGQRRQRQDTDGHCSRGCTATSRQPDAAHSSRAYKSRSHHHSSQHDTKTTGVSTSHLSRFQRSPNTTGTASRWRDRSRGSWSFI